MNSSAVPASSAAGTATGSTTGPTSHFPFLKLSKELQIMILSYVKDTIKQFHFRSGRLNPSPMLICKDLLPVCEEIYFKRLSFCATSLRRIAGPRSIRANNQRQMIAAYTTELTVDFNGPAYRNGNPMPNAIDDALNALIETVQQKNKNKLTSFTLKARCFHPVSADFLFRHTVVKLLNLDSLTKLDLTLTHTGLGAKSQAEKDIHICEHIAGLLPRLQVLYLQGFCVCEDAFKVANQNITLPLLQLKISFLTENSLFPYHRPTPSCDIQEPIDQPDASQNDFYEDRFLVVGEQLETLILQTPKLRCAILDAQVAKFTTFFWDIISGMRTVIGTSLTSERDWVRSEGPRNKQESRPHE
jgi:hypothetical protein